MSDIFISYARKDQGEARKLADALERKGFSVWWDFRLQTGKHFDDVIEQVLTETRCVIVLWSKRSVQSRYVKDEAAYALQRNKLFPVAIDEVALPFRYEGIHTPRLNGWDGSDNFPAFQKLVVDIIGVLGQSPVEGDMGYLDIKLWAENVQRKGKEEEADRAKDKTKRQLKAEEDRRQPKAPPGNVQAKASRKVVAVFVGLGSLGAVMILTQFVTLGLLTILLASGALLGYFVRNRQDGRVSTLAVTATFALVFGAVMILTQFVTLGLLTISISGGALIGYCVRVLQDKGVT